MKTALRPASHGRFQSLRRNLVRSVVDRMIGRTILCGAGELPRIGIHRILVLRPNHRLGNMLLLTPLLSEIERVYPGAEIDIVAAGPAAESAFATYSSVSQIFSFHHKVIRHLASTVLMLRRIRATRYDLSIDAATGSQSGRVLLAITRARIKVGSEAGSEAHARPLHLGHRPVYLLRRAWGDQRDFAWPVMSLRLTDEEKALGVTTLHRLLPSEERAKNCLTLSIFPNATGKKRFPDTWWFDLLDSLAERGIAFRVIEIVAAHGKSQLNGRFPTFYSSNLRRMAGLISATSAFISADCGVMHLASCSGVPTLGIFSVTDVDKYAPYGRENQGLSALDGNPNSVIEEIERCLSVLASPDSDIPIPRHDRQTERVISSTRS